MLGLAFFDVGEINLLELFLVGVDHGTDIGAVEIRSPGRRIGVAGELQIQDRRHGLSTGVGDAITYLEHIRSPGKPQGALKPDPTTLGNQLHTSRLAACAQLARQPRLGDLHRAAMVRKRLAIRRANEAALRKVGAVRARIKQQHIAVTGNGVAVPQQFTAADLTTHWIDIERKHVILQPDRLGACRGSFGCPRNLRGRSRRRSGWNAGIGSGCR